MANSMIHLCKNRCKLILTILTIIFLIRCAYSTDFHKIKTTLKGNDTILQNLKYGNYSAFVNNLFIENKGQIIDQYGKIRTDVLYIFKSKDFGIHLKKNGYSIEIWDKITADSVRFHRIDIELVNCNTNVEIIPENKNETYFNYYLPHTDNMGITHVNTFQKIIYKDIYPNIDLIFYTYKPENKIIKNNESFIYEVGAKYEFVIRPGGKIEDIILQYSGTNKIFTDNEGNLITFTSIGNIIEAKPVAKANNFNIPCSYEIDHKYIRFNVENYYKYNEIIIDPTFYHTKKIGTYYGGTSDEFSYGITVDAARNVYLTGKTNSNQYIATSGAHQTTLNGGAGGGATDIIIAKFNETLTTLIWGTYYGGGSDDEGRAITIDASSNIYLTGITQSTTGIATTGTYKPSKTSTSDKDAFVAKFNSSGTRQWGTYLGDNGEDYGISLCLDGSNNIYVVGKTTSSSSIATSGSHQVSYSGGNGLSDGFIIKLNNSGTSKIWGTYLGGSYEDLINDIVNSGQYIYIVGTTFSNNNIAYGSNLYQSSLNGTAGVTSDAFISKFDLSGYAQWSTYFGGNNSENGNNLCVDANGSNIYFIGDTKSTSNIATNNAFQTSKGTGSTEDAFISKFNSSGQIQWSTYFGGRNEDFGYSIVNDIDGNIVFAGKTKSDDNIVPSSISNYAFQKTHGGTGYFDAFLSKFTPSGSLIWSTYCGSSAEDIGFANISDNIAFMTLTGITHNSTGIATSGAYDTIYAGGDDAFVVKFCDLIISQQPQSQIAFTGNSVTFSVSIIGTQYGNYTYQWYKSGVKINGATSSTFKIDTVKTTDTGYYYCIICNSCGCVKSENAILTVYTSSPNTSICYGQVTTLSVQNITGATYEWSATTNCILTSTSSYSIQAKPTTTTTFTCKIVISGKTYYAITVITVKQLPNANAGQNISICSGKTGNIGSSPISGYSYSWSPSIGLSNSTVSNPSVTLTNSTSNPIKYNYILSVTYNGCTSHDTVEVTVNPLPSVSISPNNATICYGDTIELTASGANTYKWSTNETTSKIKVSPTSSTTYSVVGTNNYGCENTATKTVTVNPLPTITFNPSNPAICYGGSISISVSGANYYTWTPNTGLTNTSSSTVTANPLTTTTYTVTATNSSTGCKNNKNITVTVYNPPNVSASASKTTICKGDSTILSAYGANSYSWSPYSSLSSPSGASVVAKPTSNTTYMVIGTNANNCSDTDYISITVNQLPSISISSNKNAICIGDSVFLSASGGISYSWVGPYLSASYGNNVWAKPTSTSSYTVIGKDTNGCQNSSSKQITVNPLPTLSFNPANPSICLGGSINISVSGANSYLWTPSTGLNATNLSTVTASPTSTTTYSVYATDNNGCKNNKNINVTVYNPPNVSASASKTTICNKDSVILTANGALTYIWSPSNNLNSDSGSTVIAKPSYSTTYQVIGFNANNCSDTAEITIIVNQLPQLSFTPSNPEICFGDSVFLYVTGASTYSWTPSNGLNTNTGQSVKASPSSTTTYIVTGTNTNNCKDTIHIKVIVDSLPQIKFQPGNPTVCKDSAIKIVASGANSYIWYPSTGLNINYGSTVIASPTSTITYKVVGTSTKNCIDSDSVKVTVLNPPNVSVTSSKQICCEGEKITLFANGASSYYWTPSLYLSSTSGSMVYSTPKSSINYVVTGVNAANCGDTANITIKVNPKPVIISTPSSPKICYNDSIKINVFGAKNYVWSPNYNLSSTTGNNVIAYPKVSTIYTVIGTDSNNCIDTQNIEVIVNSLPFVDAGKDDTLCNQPIPFQFNGTPSNGIWTGVSNITSNGIFTPNGNGVFTIKYTYTDSNSCKNSDTKNVFVVSPILADAGKDTNICIFTSVKFAGFPSGGWWSGSTDVKSDGTFYPKTSGIHKLIYSYGANTCLTKDTVEIFVKPLPIVDAGTDIETCINNPEFLLDNNSPKGGKWSGKGIIDQINGLFNQKTAGIGKHSIHYWFKDNNTGCINEDSLTIIVNDLPVMNFSFDSIICNNKISSFSSNSGINNQYYWYFSNGYTDSGFIVSKIFKDTGLYSVKIVGKTKSGCSDTLKLFFEVIDRPNAIFTMDKKKGCDSVYVTFKNLSKGKFVSYHWDFGNGITSNALEPGTILFKPDKRKKLVYFISLIVKNKCDSSFYIDSVEVYPSPTSLFYAEPNTGCSELEVTFRNRSYGLPSRSIYYFGDGTNYLQLNYQDSIIKHKFKADLNDSIYQVSLIVSNQCGNGISNQKITVKPKTVRSFFKTNKNRICIGDTFIVTDYHVGNGKIIWDMGDGSRFPDSTILFYYFKSAGTYNVCQFIDNGCAKDTFCTKITVEPLPQVSFEINPQIQCENNLVKFVNTSKNISGLFWDFGDGTNQVGDSVVSHSYDNSGIYNPTLTIFGITPLHCKNSLTKKVEIIPLPKIDIQFTDTNGCQPFKTSIINNSKNAKYFTWYLGNGKIETSVSPTLFYSDSGTYSIKLIAESVDGCRDSLTKFIRVFPKPVSQFEIIYKQDDAPLVDLINKSILAVKFNWIWGNGLNSSNTNLKVHLNEILGFPVVLIATSQYNCEDTSQKYMSELYNGLFVPNAFSPGIGPDNVQEFKPIGIGLKDYHVRVFNTYGELLWESKSLTLDGRPAYGWNGKDNNDKPCPKDVYVWKIEAVFNDGTIWKGYLHSDGKYYTSGPVMLLR